jgi:hypothetical protein
MLQQKLVFFFLFEGWGEFCDVAKVMIIQKTFSRNVTIYPDMQVLKKKRVLLYSWLPIETYHKNIWNFYFFWE